MATAANHEDHTYTNPNHIRFVDQCKTAGLEVEYYEGRFFYRGPSVRCEDRSHLERVIRATTEKILYDELGKHGYVAYPGNQ